VLPTFHVIFTNLYNQELIFNTKEDAMQSPITIDQGNVITRNYTPFHFAGYNQTYNAQITYSDHSISINFLMDSRLPSVSGGGLFKEYVLTALDFHWDSEHVINEHK
jgi:carbonic anhydrase